MNELEKLKNELQNEIQKARNRLQKEARKIDSLRTRIRELQNLKSLEVKWESGRVAARISSTGYSIRLESNMNAPYMNLDVAQQFHTKFGVILHHALEERQEKAYKVCLSKQTATEAQHEHFNVKCPFIETLF